MKWASLVMQNVYTHLGTGLFPFGQVKQASRSQTSATVTVLLCVAGDDPEHVKTKLRHWAQAVACSVMQSK